MSCIPLGLSSFLSSLTFTLSPSPSSTTSCRNDPSTGLPAPLSAELFPPSPSPLAWEPSPHRYLLALCVFGRTSNHLLCLRRYTAFAALLNRTLIVPVVKRKGGRTRFSE